MARTQRIRDKKVELPLFKQLYDIFVYFTSFMSQLKILWPIRIFNYIIINIHSFVTSHTIGCGYCLVFSITVAISATSIAIGVGLGVGIGCAQVNYIHTNSTNG